MREGKWKGERGGKQGRKRRGKRGKGKEERKERKLCEKREGGRKEGREEESEDGGPINEEKKESMYLGPHGHYINKHAMHTLTRGGCCSCTNNIEEYDYEDVHWMQNGLPMCLSCFEIYENPEFASAEVTLLH